MLLLHLGLRVRRQHSKAFLFFIYISIPCSFLEGRGVENQGSHNHIRTATLPFPAITLRTDQQNLGTGDQGSKANFLSKHRWWALSHSCLVSLLFALDFFLVCHFLSFFWLFLRIIGPVFLRRSSKSSHANPVTTWTWMYEGTLVSRRRRLNRAAAVRVDYIIVMYDSVCECARRNDRIETV